MFEAIVVAGGSARRLGGADKPALQVGRRSLLEHVLAAVEDASRVVVVGPRRHLARPVLWCREDPPGGGPVAALAAGVEHLSAPTVIVLAADLPAIGPAVPALLAAFADGDAVDCALLTDTGGRRNYLAAAWRLAALRRALASLPQVSGAAVRRLYAEVRVREVIDGGGWSRDCDTWTDVAAARNDADWKKTT